LPTCEGEDTLAPLNLGPESLYGTRPSKKYAYFYQVFLLLLDVNNNVGS